MGNLLKAELFKLRKSFHYKLLLLFPFGIGLIFGGLIYYYDSQTVGMRMFSVWGTGTLYNAVLISIFAAEYIGSEFANRTFAASISCGAPRRRLFAVKCIIFFLALLPLIYIQDLTTFLILSYKNGLGIAWNMEAAAYIANKIFCSSLCNLTMGSFILLLAFCENPLFSRASHDRADSYFIAYCHCDFDTYSVMGISKKRFEIESRR